MRNFWGYLYAMLAQLVVNSDLHSPFPIFWNGEFEFVEKALKINWTKTSWCRWKISLSYTCDGEIYGGEAILMAPEGYYCETHSLGSSVEVAV